MNFYEAYTLNETKTVRRNDGKATPEWKPGEMKVHANGSGFTSGAIEGVWIEVREPITTEVVFIHDGIITHISLPPIVQKWKPQQNTRWKATFTEVIE